MILDFNNLTLEQSKEFTVCYHEFQPGFNDLIEKLTKSVDHKTNPSWLFSKLLSRNIYQSPIVLQCAKLYYIRHLLNKGVEISKIIIDDPIAGRVLSKSLKHTKVIERGFKARSISFSIAKQSIKIIIDILSGLILKSLDRKRQIPKDRELIIIDTFFLDNSRLAKKYIDRYYTGIYDYLEDETINKIFFCPTILTKFSEKELNELVAGSNHKFIFKHDFLTISDYLYAIILLIKQNWNRRTSVFYEGFEISSIIKYNHTLLKYSAYESVLNYIFIGRLNKSDVLLDAFVDWNENQPIDKSIIRGIRDNYPECKIIGYQSYYIDRKFNFYLSPTKYELNEALIPDRIAVPGRGLINYVDRFNSGVCINVAPALRYNLEELVFQPELSNTNNILVFLNIILEDSINIVNLVNEAGLSNYHFVFRAHPSHAKKTIQKLKNLIELDNFSFSTEPLVDDIKKSSVACGSITSALFECIAYGLPAIIIGNCKGLTQIPIPDSVESSIWEVVYTPSDFKEAIIEKTSLACSNYNEFRKTAQKVRAEYFLQPNESNVRQLFSVK